MGPRRSAVKFEKGSEESSIGDMIKGKDSCPNRQEVDSRNKPGKRKGWKGIGKG